MGRRKAGSQAWSGSVGRTVALDGAGRPAETPAHDGRDAYCPHCQLLVTDSGRRGGRGGLGSAIPVSVSEQSRSSSSGLAAVSNGIVQLLRETYGRGPTKAKTYLNDNVVLVVLEDILTTVERTLLDDGKESLVREVRLTYQAAESNRFKGVVEDALGRKVLTYHSQVTFSPDMAFEIFVLDPE